MGREVVKVLDRGQCVFSEMRHGCNKLRHRQRPIVPTSTDSLPFISIH